MKAQALCVSPYHKETLEDTGKHWNKIVEGRKKQKMKISKNIQITTPINKCNK